MMHFQNFPQSFMVKLIERSATAIFLLVVQIGSVQANGSIFFGDPDEAFREQTVSYFGTVRDRKGGTIPGAKVLVTVARDKVETYTVVADKRGKYRTPAYAGADTRRVQLFAEKTGYKFDEFVLLRGPKKQGDASEVDIIMTRIQ